MLSSPAKSESMTAASFRSKAGSTGTRPARRASISEALAEGAPPDGDGCGTPVLYAGPPVAEAARAAKARFHRHGRGSAGFGSGCRRLQRNNRALAASQTGLEGIDRGQQGVEHGAIARLGTAQFGERVYASAKAPRPVACRRSRGQASRGAQ